MYGVAVVLILVLGAGGYAAWNAYRDRNTPDQAAADYVNYDEPTEEERKAGDEQKAENEARDQEPAKAGEQAGQTPAPASANLTLTDAAQYEDVIEVRAYVSNVYETGTCSAVFQRQGQATVTTTSKAFKDASTVQCGANDTARSKFTAAGDWSMTLTFTSDSGVTGTTDQTIRIK